LGSYVSGFAKPGDIDCDLISHPVQTFLHSLSEESKERLNIPLKHFARPEKVVIQEMTTITLEDGREEISYNLSKSNTLEIKV